MTNLFEKLRAWLEQLDHQVEELPEGTFKSTGTTVRALLVTLHKRTIDCSWCPTEPLNVSGPKLSRSMNSASFRLPGASNIEFNNTTQQWEVKDRRGEVRFIAKFRSTCLEWEQQNLQPE